ncbi:putative deoxyribonuclease [Mycoplasmopsis canis UF31]|uniref:TatD family hydrolase n=1 Tax=Mycoplasmopsis canis TaxID=29555 RepID=UPI00025ADBF7|nr:TatD family hydrolase [Mycoplasmopsis canis]EIE41033.1 putative deoxyribonuclease [Mycoplasmopsis canis UF31]
MSKKRNMFIDSHCHVSSKTYQDFHIEEIVLASKYNNIEFFINNGGHPEENLEVIELAKKYDVFKACIGIHPEAGENGDDYLKIKQLLEDNKEYIIGIGEIGLDYYYDDAPSRENQINSMENQIKLAYENNLPVVIHIRDKEGEFLAYEDTYKILKKYPNLKSMLHTFAGNVEWAKKFMEFPNLFFSFSGVVTFGSSNTTREVIEFLPLERILNETDSPFLRVHPYSGQKNEPNTVLYVYYYIAGVKKVGLDKYVDRINKNVRKLFNL